MDAILSAPKRWEPLPGPQTAALQSQADVLLYGGAAGGGKTDLALGKALTQHRRTLILRREFPQLKGILERAQDIYSPFGAWNGQQSTWRCRWGGMARVIELGSCQHETDRTKYQGRPHDLLVFDEAANFLESQVQFIAGWLRTEIPGQRCQLLLCSNPPTDANGDWLMWWFGPWLDAKHRRPAKAGELRWFAVVGGKTVEVDGPEPFHHKGETIAPKSRTFIPARVTDNPYYMASGYASTLQALPEPLRSKMLYGDFAAGREDAANQVIPADWVRLAQERWTSRPKPTTPMSAIGLDVARGGKDRTVLTPRHDNWVGEQICEPGKSTPDGPAVAALVVAHRRGNAVVNIDIIGVGGSPYDHLKPILKDKLVAMNGAEGSEKRDRSGQLGFANQRAEWWWGMREALEPGSGQDLALPPDPELLADLCAPTWRLTPRGVLVEAKDDVIARIGRSPDKGDSCVYAVAIKDMPYAGLFGFMEGRAAEIEAARAAQLGDPARR